MRRVIQLTVAISISVFPPLSAQELLRVEERGVEFRVARPIDTGRTTLNRVQEFDENLPLFQWVVFGGVLGAIGGGGLGFLYGIFVDCSRIEDDPGYGMCGGPGGRSARTSAEENSCVEKSCWLIATAVGAGVGFAIGAVVGGIYGAGRRGARPSGRGGRRRRANATVVPLHNGRLGVGAAVRF